MRKFNRLNFAVAMLSYAGMVLAPTAMAAAPPSAPNDVALGEGGVLLGQVMDSQGIATAHATVTLADHQQEITRVRTDELGKFSVPNLRGGVYQISYRGQTTLYRLWAANTAPPVAQQSVTLVTNGDVVRGQYGNSPGPFGSIAQWVADHPLITASAVGAAIAIPIALNDDNDSTPPSTP